MRLAEVSPPSRWARATASLIERERPKSSALKISRRRCNGGPMVHTVASAMARSREYHGSCCRLIISVLGGLSRNCSVKSKSRPHPGPLPRGEGEVFPPCVNTHWAVPFGRVGRMQFPLLGERVRVRADQHL